MTAKLFRTTSVIAMAAFSMTAVCAASSSVRAEPGEALRIAQKADDNEANQKGAADNPGAADNNGEVKRKGEGQRREGNRPDRGEGGRNRGGDGNGDGRGSGPDKVFNKPDAEKPNAPKIINKPNEAESRDAAPAIPKPSLTPSIKPVLKPVERPLTPPIENPTAGHAIKPPVKTAVPPPNPDVRSTQNPFPINQPRRNDERNAPQIDRTQGPAAAYGLNNRGESRRDQNRQRDAIRPFPNPPVKNLNDAKVGRVESREQGGNRLVIREADKRTIVKQGNNIVIQKDESAQLRRLSPNAVVTRDGRGRDRTVVRRGNAEVVTETDRNGQLLRRFRRDHDGRETVIIDNRRRSKDKFGRNLAIGVGVGAGIIAGAAILNSVVDVPPPRVRVPRDKYIVDYERASDEDVYEALSAPPVDEIDRGYTLDQVRATPYLRERMRRVDLDDITFETGSWDIDPGQYRKLERIARAMRRVIDRNPNEVFLIEGYTDAVGSEVDNLTLSDRRAEAVSVVLTQEFGVPFENLTTQGYGEQYLKIPTDGPERENRRVAARRITPLLNHDVSSAAPPRPRPGYDERDEYDEPPRDRRWRRYN